MIYLKIMQKCLSNLKPESSGGYQLACSSLLWGNERFYGWRWVLEVIVKKWFHGQSNPFFSLFGNACASLCSITEVADAAAAGQALG